jgi:hypothetical protein
MLVPVANDANFETILLSILQRAASHPGGALLSSDERQALDQRHHVKWATAQAAHIADNEQFVEHRIQSLTVSHRARCKAVEDQLARATNERIRVMREGELARAQADFDRRMEELTRAAATGDIRVAPVVFGSIVVTKGDRNVGY